MLHVAAAALGKNANRSAGRTLARPPASAQSCQLPIHLHSWSPSRKEAVLQHSHIDSADHTLSERLLLTVLLNSNELRLNFPVLAPMPYRVLVTTHHITSRAKVLSLTRAAEAHRVSVLIKMTAKPPGIMICEGDDEAHARGWLAAVRSLRYLGYRFVKGESVSGPRLVNDGKNGVHVSEGTREFLEALEKADQFGKTEPALQVWWRQAMGFAKQ